jgi:hypothetical protein
LFRIHVITIFNKNLASSFFSSHRQRSDYKGKTGLLDPTKEYEREKKKGNIDENKDNNWSEFPTTETMKGIALNGLANYTPTFYNVTASITVRVFFWQRMLLFPSTS